MLNFESGSRLRAAANSIADATLIRDYAKRPFLLDRYGENGRTRYREEILHSVAALAAAVDANDVTIFLRAVAWLKVYLLNRGVALEDIDESLRCLAAVITNESVSNYSTATLHLQAAIDQLAAMPDEAASFIEPSNEEHQTAQRCLEALLGLDASTARTVLEESIAANTPLTRIYLGILPPLMHEIGRLWQMNRISIAHEHYCSSAVQSILGGFYRLMFGVTQPSGRSILVACVDGEQHEIGARSLADVFELHGWRTSFLGANLPQRELVALIKQARRPPDLIALSATMPGRLAQIASTVVAIRDGSNIPVMVGGYLFHESPDLATQLGADGYAGDAAAALAVADELVARPV